MHDAIFRNQTEITPSVADDKIKALAGEIEGLNKTTLADCMQRQLSLGAVLRDQQLGKQLGVNGTPTIFINGEVQHIGSPDTFHQMLLDYLQGTSSDESGLYIPAKASPSQPDKGSSFAGATALEKSTKP
jgi:hypothetical protein